MAILGYPFKHLFNMTDDSDLFRTRRSSNGRVGAAGQRIHP